MPLVCVLVMLRIMKTELEMKMAINGLEPVSLGEA